MFAAKNPSHIKGFGPEIDGFDQVPFGDHFALENAINENTAAIMVETIFGEGGIKVVPDQCLRGLRNFVIKNILYFSLMKCNVELVELAKCLRLNGQK